MSVAKKNSLLVRHRQALIAARKHFVFTNTAVSDDYHVAYEALGGNVTDEMMTPAEKKRLDDARRKRKQEKTWYGAAGAGRGGNPMAFGVKKFRRDKFYSPCFECK